MSFLYPQGIVKGSSAQFRQQSGCIICSYCVDFDEIAGFSWRRSLDQFAECCNRHEGFGGWMRSQFLGFCDADAKELLKVEYSVSEVHPPMAMIYIQNEYMYLLGVIPGTAKSRE